MILNAVAVPVVLPATSVAIAQLIVVVIGASLTIIQITRNVTANRIANLLAVTKNHREIWSMLMDRDELHEIMMTSSKIRKANELSTEQRLFLNFLLLHMAAAFASTRSGLLTRNKSVSTDVGELMSLPAPFAFWSEQKRFHHKPFARFVDRSIKKYGSLSSETAARGG